MNATIRPATTDDLPAVLEIERDSFPSQHWGEEEFLSYRCTVIEADGRIAGFVVMRELFHGPPPELEILNLAIAPAFRQLGLASVLLSSELQLGSTYLLEVRESNTAARRLYEKFGFREISRRTNYYRAPTETAIVMQVK